MPRNRMTFHDPRDELPPVTIEILKGDMLRFTQVDREGRTNVVTFSERFDVFSGFCGVIWVFLSATPRPTSPLTVEG
jgi:hypothetical protein